MRGTGSLWSWLPIGVALACVSGAAVATRMLTKDTTEEIRLAPAMTEPSLQPMPTSQASQMPGPFGHSVPDKGVCTVAFLNASTADDAIAFSVQSVILTAEGETTRELHVEAAQADAIFISGDYRLGTIKIKFSVDDPVQGKMEARFGGLQVGDVRISDANASPEEAEVAIQVSQLASGRKPQELRWKFSADGNSQERSGKVLGTPLLVDFTGPRVRSPSVVEFGEAKTVVDLHFRDVDLDVDTVTVPENYYIERLTEQGNFEARRNPDDSPIQQDDPHVVRLTFSGELKNGGYRLTLPATPVSGEKNRPLRDIAGNYVGGTGSKGETVEVYFGLNPAPKEAKHVEFPEFLPTAPQPTQHRRVNAGDKVETRVLRLFYFRDAHRVAQLINRTAESLNMQAVTLAERRAEDARKQADEFTDERRAQERAAVRAAEDLRRSENQLEEYQQIYGQEADQLQRLNAERDRMGREIADTYDERQRLANNFGITAPSPVTRAGQKLPDAEASKDQRLRGHDVKLISLAEELSRIDSSRTTQQEQINKLANTVGTLRNAVDEQRKTAAIENEEAQVAQAKEDRAHEEQFRLEVAAAHEDPDTFAAAQKNSVDPVAQCSVSVIGEGLLQVRGPRKGIDKIRTMVHQIDMPLGQVKVEVVTVQLNGERGERMERPLGRVEAQINQGRFLTSQSLKMLRQAIVAEASMVAEQVDMGGHYQVDRDRKYLYAFFGRDFIDELYEMDSEFLRSENKVLSLHSMDTVGLHQATFVLALARNDVRQRILARFMEMVRTDLVQAEFDFRRTSELKPHKTWHWLPHHSRAHKEEAIYEGVCLNNQQRYHFRNLLTFFGQMEGQLGGTMNPMQREFIRLAQIFKSRLVAEMELKQRIIERTMIEDDRELDLQAEEAAQRAIRERLLLYTEKLQNARFDASEKLGIAISEARQAFAASLADADALRALIPQAQMQAKEAVDAINEAGESATAQAQIEAEWAELKQGTKHLDLDDREVRERLLKPVSDERLNKFRSEVGSANEALRRMEQRWKLLKNLYPNVHERSKELGKIETELECYRDNLDEVRARAEARQVTQVQLLNAYGALARGLDCRSAFYTELEKATRFALDYYRNIQNVFNAYYEAATPASFHIAEVTKQRSALIELLTVYPQDADRVNLQEQVNAISVSASELDTALRQRDDAQGFLEETRRSLGQRKLLDFLIEEQEEKVADLREGTRAHLARMDDYLKRMMIALEDDFNMQYYDPAFVRIRHAAREWDVTLGQVERTSILTNNRAFAKVTPQATMEFDLPKRKIAVVEAFDAAQALVQDYGAMMNDPTFLAAAELMGAGQPNGMARKVYPSLPNSGEEQQMQYSDLPPEQSGSALEQLVPDPSIYKFETGTGYEIRPVIQPDGYSIVYDFNYMYTTNVREPVQADEKHLGRIKRHFIDTQVQTGSFEMREVSRYQVALKAARTAQGVPLLQDIPVLGLAFRPLPSAESSIQQNVILARSVVYPTVFDVMGLRWAPSVVDLSHEALRDQEHVVRGRHRTVTDAVYDMTSGRVDTMLGIGVGDDHRQRPDLYRRQRRPSPYHPGGYTYPEMSPEDDPTGRGFEHEDERPTEMQQPPYDPRFRQPTRFESLPPVQQPMDSQPGNSAFSPSEGQMILRNESGANPAERGLGHQETRPPKVQRLPPVSPDWYKTPPEEVPTTQQPTGSHQQSPPDDP